MLPATCKMGSTYLATLRCNSHPSSFSNVGSLQRKNEMWKKDIKLRLDFVCSSCATDPTRTAIYWATSYDSFRLVTGCIKRNPALYRSEFNKGLVELRGVWPVSRTLANTLARPLITSRHTFPSELDRPDYGLLALTRLLFAMIIKRDSVKINLK